MSMLELRWQELNPRISSLLSDIRRGNVLERTNIVNMIAGVMQGII
jgi:hypothetical protein